MKAKMSKRYINYEEELLEPVRKNQTGRVREKIKVTTILLYILCNFLGATIRTWIFSIAVLISLTPAVQILAIDRRYCTFIGVIYLIGISYLFLSWLFRWIEDRVCIWRINYYMHSNQFERIWTSPLLYEYINSNKGGIFFGNLRFYNWPIFDFLDNRIIQGDNYPEFHWNSDSFGGIFRNEVLWATKRFLLGNDVRILYTFGDTLVPCNLSRSITNTLWTIVYYIVLVLLIGFEMYAALFSNFSLWIRILCGIYLLLHFRISLIRSIKQDLMAYSGISVYKNDNNPIRRNTYGLLTSSDYFYLMSGKPSRIIENRNGIFKPSFTFKNFNLSANVRFLVKMLRLITII